MNVCTIAARISGGASAPRRRNTSFPGTARTAAWLPSISPAMTPNITPITMRPYSGMFRHVPSKPVRGVTAVVLSKVFSSTSGYSGYSLFLM